MHIKPLLFLSAASASLSKAAALPAQAKVAQPHLKGAHDGANNTSLVINKRLNLQEVEVGCNRNVDHTCHKRIGLVDTDSKVPQTCPRKALAAKANFLDTCADRPTEPPEATGARYCGGAMPTIQLCCGAWVWRDDALASAWPTARDYDTGLVMPMYTGAQILDKKASSYQFGLELIEGTQILDNHQDWVFRKALKPDAWQYNSRVRDCEKWEPLTEAEFQYWYQSLLEYHIDEVTETVDSNEPRIGPPNDH